MSSATATKRSFADASPSEIRAALIPEEQLEFDQQYRDALRHAAEAYSLDVLSQTLESWRRVAWMTTAGGPDAHRRMLRTAAARVAGKTIPPDEPLASTKARLGL
jgi:hypothetical protein